VIELDTASPVPPYEQVKSQFARQIADRRLAVGTRLPTVRQLAADLGLAVNTVARAYRELEEAGLVQTRGRAGTFVSPAGEHSLQRAQQAAHQFAVATADLGLSPDALLQIVRAALDQRPTPDR
jgi:DNA-binding transcriptional regulator YhcF (GntR family)